MEDAQVMDNGQDGQEVLESLGMDGAHESESQAASQEQAGSSGETLSVQKRLKAQKRAHEREVRELHARIGELETRMSQPKAAQLELPSYDSHNGSIDEHIHKAVSYALQHKELEERKAREAQAAAHLNKQYGELQKHLDHMADKYDDFHETVLGADTPFTSTMRDYALTLPRSGAGSAGEVLYKLARNPDELRRIKDLHPIDQASEMARLSHALISGANEKASTASRQPLGSIKNNPVVNNNAITDKTPIGDLRRRMRAGFK